MNFKYYVFGLLMLAACSEKEVPTIELPQPSAEATGIVMSGEDYLITPATRAGFDIIDNTAKFKWTTGDVVGVFPVASNIPGEVIRNDGDQVEFPLSKEVIKDNYATFNGGGWDLRPKYSYVAYYPLKPEWGVDKYQVEISYEGQTYKGISINQETGARFIDLSKHDFMTAQAETANEQGLLNFRFQHVGALIFLQFPMEKAGTLTNITLKGKTMDINFIVAGTIDLTQTPQDSEGKPLAQTLEPTKTATTFAVGIDPTAGIRTERNYQIAEVIFQMPPMNFKKDALTLTYSYTDNQDNQNYEKSHSLVINKPIEAGKGYTLRAQVDKPHHIHVYQAGNLSQQISDPTDKKMILSGNINGEDFNLLHYNPTVNQYLTHLFLTDAQIVNGGTQVVSQQDKLDKALLSGLYNLKAIALPSQLKSMDEAALEGCTKLQELIISTPYQPGLLTEQTLRGLNTKNIVLYLLDSSWHNTPGVINGRQFANYTWKSIRKTRPDDVPEDDSMNENVDESVPQDGGSVMSVR